MITRIITSILFALIFVCCGHNDPDSRLSNISSLCEQSPKEALDSLNAISKASLSEEDKHFYDFLSIKVKDKAFITHTSDSLILKVIDYESKHQDNGHYPEALYYGGRVYSDLGDYPTSLKYYQDALSETPSELDIKLRSVILSQTASLLHDLRLYDEAILYIKEALHLDSLQTDYYGLAYDHQLIGLIYLNSSKSKEARPYILKSLEFASKLSSEIKNEIRVNFAGCEYKENNLDLARSIIREVIDSVTPRYKNLTLSIASDIYLKSNILDTAYLYAFELAHSKHSNNRKNGFEKLLSDELISKSHPDSIICYIRTYNKILEEYYDKHESQQALMQQSLYNYQLHEREKTKAFASRNKIMIGFFVSVTLVLIIVVIFLLYRNHTKQTIIRLHETIARLDAIQHRKEDSHLSNTNITTTLTPDLLRKQLKERIANLQDIPLPLNLINSKSYAVLLNHAKNGAIIHDSSELWKELYDLILQDSPDFETNLRLLMGGNIKHHELQTIILIRCGITPSQMAPMLGKAKGSISSRRESLSFKIFGEKTNQKNIDAVIRSL
ncbi:MAG: tetratricopeptide repeat protein [Bacteroidales bacterium]|nr:tetratricopeptide repeat protein [Bacteroidales bacterium]